MSKNRLEAFSDGVMAIIITIMVLEMHVPKGADIRALAEIAPVFLSYVLSFVIVGIYWNNHHHMLHTVKNVNGPVLWANLHLLFWLTLFPFVTGWMGENAFGEWPVALYGIVMFMAGIAYYILAHTLIRYDGKEGLLAVALGKDLKGIISVAAYATAVPVAFWNRWVSMGLFVFVALMWLVPDSRIEKTIDRRT